MKKKYNGMKSFNLSKYIFIKDQMSQYYLKNAIIIIRA